MGSTVVIEFHDLVGMAGVVCILAMYLAVQTGRARGGGLGYSLANLAGALMILYSLLFEFNLSAVIIETCWVLISVVGLVRWWTGLRNRGADKKPGPKPVQKS
jgi:hypothetical protein